MLFHTLYTAHALLLLPSSPLLSLQIVALQLLVIAEYFHLLLVTNSTQYIDLGTSGYSRPREARVLS